MAMIHSFPWPFLVIKDLPKEKVYVQRMMETVVSAILISIIVGGFGGYLLLKVLDAKFEDNKEYVSQRFGYLYEQINHNSDHADKNTDKIIELSRDFNKK